MKMIKSEYLEKHHAITETTLGTVHLHLSNELPALAKIEIEKGISELDELSNFYKENGAEMMHRKVSEHKDWKKEGGLYRHWKCGVRNFKEAYKIILGK